MSPEAALNAFLRRMARRMSWLAAARGATAALCIAAAAALSAASVRSSAAVPLAVAVAAVGCALAIAAALRTRRDPAAAVESRVPCRNVLITAAGLGERTDTPTHIRERVYSDALKIVSMHDAGDLFPATRSVSALAASITIFVIALAIPAFRPDALPALQAAVTRTPGGIDEIDVSIQPPSYSLQPSRTISNPSSLEVLAGTVITVVVRADVETMEVETLSGRTALRRTGQRTFEGVLTADADGYVALQPTTKGVSTARRLIPLRVTPDQVPAARITAPARDLFFAEANGTISIAFEATDDLGLRSLSLRYTKASGSGEQFTFIDGEIPIRLIPVSATSWRAAATLQLKDFALGAGDMLVYRAVATDRSPTAHVTESDSYIIEITSPGSIPMEGFSADDEDRYALSQQMVIMKTERLIAAAPTMEQDSLTYAAMSIAAEQRSVRAEFVFMMGGELAEEVLAEASMGDLNEEAHAESDDEVIAGRLANQGRVALLTAIRSMSRASAALTAGDLTRALTEERIALTNLQRAFSRTRYILRALSQRERLDQSRRLSGNLESANPAARAPARPQSEEKTIALRRILAAVAVPAGEGDPLTISAAARDLMRMDRSREGQRIGALLDSVAVAIAGQRTQQAGVMIDRAVVDLSAMIRTRMSDAPQTRAGIENARLRGAFSDALRARRR